MAAQVDDAFQGSDREAVEMAAHLLRRDGLFVGSSAAMNLVGAAKAARALGPGHTIVTVSHARLWGRVLPRVQRKLGGTHVLLCVLDNKPLFMGMEHGCGMPGLSVGHYSRGGVAPDRLSLVKYRLGDMRGGLDRFCELQAQPVTSMPAARHV